MQTEREDESSPEELIGLSDFNASGSDQLSFTTGDRLLVHAKTSSEWWWAELQGAFGYVPASYLHHGVGEEEDNNSFEDPWQDEEYFGSYGTLRLHLEMLSDKTRTEAYRQVIVNNSSSLRGKVLLDLGCGTGIISLFCARLAQPSVVYAVEASSVAEYTRQLVKQNGCEGVVTVLQGRAEELDLPERVDVLVSEWMGNCLLFEFMVESVLVARDRWLREGGVMWPSSAALTLVPCQAQGYYTDKMAFWERPYGLDFTPLQPVAQQEFFTKPKFSHQIEPDDCLATPCDVITLDMYTLQVTDLEEMKGLFKFEVERSGTFHGFTAWFTVLFQSLVTGGAMVELNTGPNSEPLFPQANSLEADLVHARQASQCASWRLHQRDSYPEKEHNLETPYDGYLTVEHQQQYRRNRELPGRDKEFPYVEMTASHSLYEPGYEQPIKSHTASVGLVE